jgi:hypothetical protein
MCGFGNATCCVSGVRIHPGQMVVQSMPSGASSIRSESNSELTPALEAQ